MKASPAFQFYVADFLVGTAEMTAEEVGGYIRLLCYQWSKGGLPIENKKLMQLSGLFDLDSLNTVKTKFIEIDGLLKNERMEKTRSEQDDYRLKQSEASKKSWENRRLRNGEPMASHTEANGEPMPVLMASQSSLPSTSSTTNTNTKSNNNISTHVDINDHLNIDFEKLKEFWNTKTVNTSVPKIQIFSKQRKSKIKSLLIEHGKDSIIKAINNLFESDFCTGKSGNWKADFDFLIQQSSFIKLIEGSYSNNNNQQTQNNPQILVKSNLYDYK